MITGNRKFLLGALYVIGAIGCIESAILTEAGAGVIGAVAAATVSIATGLGVIVWGNAKEWEAKTRNGGG